MSKTSYSDLQAVSEIIPEHQFEFTFIKKTIRKFLLKQNLELFGK